MGKRLAILAGLAALMGAGAAAHAGEIGRDGLFSAGSLVSDIRVGIYAHDMYPHWLAWDVTKYHFDQIEDVNLEVLLRLPDVDAIRFMGSPKVSLGTTINLDGQESLVHLGLTWQVPIGNTPVFVEATAGGAIHNGILTGPFRGSGFLRPQGCRVEFYSGVGLGMNLNKNVYALLSYEHMSNANLCKSNDGLSNMGLRVGFRFD